MESSSSIESSTTTNISSSSEVVLVCDVSSHVVDIGYDLNAGTPFWPGSNAFQLCIQTYQSPDEDSMFYAAGTITSCSEHSGTHVDAPYHFNRLGKTVDKITLRELIAPCRMIAIDARIQENPHDGLTVDDILLHESIHGQIPSGSIVLVYTGWSRKYSIGYQEYMGCKEKNEAGELIDPNEAMLQLAFPGITEAAADVLIARGIAGVGLDTPSLDIGSSGLAFAVHRKILGAGIYGIENLSGSLQQVPPRGATVMVMPMKLTGGTGAPTRVVALFP